MLDKKEIDNIFSYHSPRGDQPERYEKIRAKARELAHVIVECTPSSADQTASIRKLREAVMTANASIALEPSPTELDQAAIEPESALPEYAPELAASAESPAAEAEPLPGQTQPEEPQREYDASAPTPSADTQATGNSF